MQGGIERVYIFQVAAACACAQGLQHLVQAETHILHMFQCLNLHYLSTFLIITETTGQGQSIPFVKSIPFCNIKAAEEEGTHGRLVASKHVSLFGNSGSSCALCCIDGKNASDALHILCTVLSSLGR